MHYEPIHFLRLHCTYIILDLLQHLPPQDFKSPDKKTPIPIGLKKKKESQNTNAIPWHVPPVYSGHIR